MKEDIIKIRRLLPMDEILAQLAEEASELSKAALKLRRALTGENPTPLSTFDCYEAIQEEIFDVINCIEVAGLVQIEYNAPEIERKRQRWIKRLEERDEPYAFGKNDNEENH